MSGEQEEEEEGPELEPPVTEMDARLIGAGDGSVMLYCRPCGLCLAPRVATLNAAAGIWEEHAASAHEPQPEPAYTPSPDPWAAPEPAGGWPDPPF